MHLGRNSIAGMLRGLIRWSLPKAAPVAAVLGMLAGDAFAQSVNCAAIQSQIAALARQPASPQSATYSRAAQKQQAELAKTIGYANTLGCNRRQFLFFGDPPPPQCGALNQRIAAMQANLGRLQSAVQNSGSEQQRRMLTAQYDAYCRQQVAGRPGNFFEQLFGGPSRMQEIPIEPDPNAPRDDEELERGPRRGSMAVCVRKCDGGFFPVSYSANRQNLDDLADMCSALCPNTETVLFTKRPDAEISEAMSYEGDSYESLTNAGRFKTKFDPSCTCKPKNRSWAEVLADAEKLLANKNKRDLIVTPEKAEELSRPTLSAAAARAARTQPGKPLPQSDEDRAVEALQREGKVEAEAASRSNAGIAPGRATSGQNYSITDGRREEVTTPAGEKRTVRVVGPKT